MQDKGTESDRCTMSFAVIREGFTDESKFEQRSK